MLAASQQMSNLCTPAIVLNIEICNNNRKIKFQRLNQTEVSNGKMTFCVALYNRPKNIGPN